MSTTTNILTQDDEVLDQLHAKNLSKSKRPYASAYTQQTLPTWVPIMTSKIAVLTCFIVGGTCAVFGALLFAASEDIFQQTVEYSNICTAPPSACLVAVTINKDLNSDLYIYYGLTNYYQNYRKYVKSVDYSQLSGGNQMETNPCAPLDIDPVSGLPYAPCGFIANSFFNDSLVSMIDQTGKMYTLSSSNIAWDNDIGKKFKNPASGFAGTVAPPNWGFNISTLPSSPGAGVGYENEDFVNWMRTMATPDFRKLWRKVGAPIPAGTYTFNIQNNYDTSQFGGKKKLILATTKWSIGGKNYSLGTIYLLFGGLYCLLAVLFMVKQTSNPRRLGDPQFLRWNHERRRL